MSALDRALARIVDGFVEECSAAFATALASAAPGSRFAKVRDALDEEYFVAASREALRTHVERAFLSDAGPNIVARVAVGDVATRAIVDAVVASAIADLVRRIESEEAASEANGWSKR